MRLITDSIPALIAYFDRDGVYRYINRGYQEWFGLDTANPGAASAMESLGAGTDTRIRSQLARALAGEAVTYEYETALVGGRRVDATDHADPGDRRRRRGGGLLRADLRHHRTEACAGDAGAGAEDGSAGPA